MLHQTENDTIDAHDSPFTQTVTVSIFCVDFPNKAHTLTAQEVEKRFNSATLNDLRDYWSELSKGHLKFYILIIRLSKVKIILFK